MGKLGYVWLLVLLFISKRMLGEGDLGKRAFVILFYGEVCVRILFLFFLEFELFRG